VFLEAIEEDFDRITGWTGSKPSLRASDPVHPV